MSFVDNFWGTEDITAGFQVLCGHVRKGLIFLFIYYVIDYLNVFIINYCWIDLNHLNHNLSFDFSF